MSDAGLGFHDTAVEGDALAHYVATRASRRVDRDSRWHGMELKQLALAGFRDLSDDAWPQLRAARKEASRLAGERRRREAALEGRARGLQRRWVFAVGDEATWVSSGRRCVVIECVVSATEPRVKIACDGRAGDTEYTVIPSALAVALPTALTTGSDLDKRERAVAAAEATLKAKAAADMLARQRVTLTALGVKRLAGTTTGEMIELVLGCTPEARRDFLMESKRLVATGETAANNREATAALQALAAVFAREVDRRRGRIADVLDTIPAGGYVRTGPAKEMPVVFTRETLGRVLEAAAFHEACRAEDVELLETYARRVADVWRDAGGTIRRVEISRLLHGISTSSPRRRCEPPPRNIHVVAAASSRPAPTEDPPRNDASTSQVRRPRSAAACWTARRLSSRTWTRAQPRSPRAARPPLTPWTTTAPPPTTPGPRCRSTRRATRLHSSRTPAA